MANAVTSMAAAALLALAVANPAAGAERREPYAAPVGTCDGYPRLPIGMRRW